MNGQEHGTSSVWGWLLITVFGVGSRLATAVFYIEDPDSLRFALSVYDGFSVAELQPHFPGYPLFWGLARVLYALTGSLGVTFALIGGLATVGILAGLLWMLGWKLSSSEGIALSLIVVLNPLAWLMGTRYMPDLSGLALLCVTLALLISAIDRQVPDVTGGGEKDSGFSFDLGTLGWIGAGLLAGWRLSYLPALLVPLAVRFWRGRARFHNLGWGAAGVVVWLVPMIVDTGWSALIAAALKQTQGHFTEFGGTVVDASSSYIHRMLAFVQSVWADGLGGWWAGRHPITVLVGSVWVLVLVRGIPALPWKQLSRPIRGMLAGGVVLYGLWVLFFQNIVHKPRHVLPLLVPVWIVGAAGAATLWRAEPATNTLTGSVQRWSVRLALLVGLAAYGVTSIVLVYQHRSPSAPAQMKRYVADLEQQYDRPLNILATPLVNYYLAGQGVKATYYSLRDSVDRSQAKDYLAARPTVRVGSEPPEDWPSPDTSQTFFHNPFVNRMWPQVDTYVYRPVSARD